MLQILLILILFIILIIPMGKYLYHIAVGEPTFADRAFNPIDRKLFRLCG
ncbi:MAG: potassium-transporting ATPase subunit KdpA, partial [Anaerovorax sp.]